MLTSLCCGKFLANTLPPPSSLLPSPSPHPTNGCIYPPITDIMSALCSHDVNLKSGHRKNSTEIFLSRYWHCSVWRQARFVGYWLPGVKFRSGIPPKTHHFPDWMTFLLSYLHTCHLYPIVAGQTSLCSRGDPPRTLTVEIPDILTLTLLTRRHQDCAMFVTKLKWITFLPCCLVKNVNKSKMFFDTTEKFFHGSVSKLVTSWMNL